MIKVGSLSFSLASQLFGRSTRDAAHFLYSWCRHCDDHLDKVDLRKDLSHDERYKLKARHLTELRDQTRSAYRGEPQTDFVFVAFQHVVQEYKIPEQYAMDLLDGMEMDALNFEYKTQADLELYCYRVAGVVGLMMSHIMGINDEKALAHAVAMGNAMQMTNIARDIKEDFSMGRVYLPQEWLSEAGASKERLLQPHMINASTQVVTRLLNLAQINYQMGYAGLKFLPFRAALAVAAAGEVYSTIGKIVSKRGARAWDQRAIVPLWKKLVAVARGLFRVMKIVPLRAFSPWSKRVIKITWRPS
jgi:phytoene synthase